MKVLLFSAFLLAAVGIGYPLVNEDTTSVCGAVERRLLTSLSSASRADLPTTAILGSLQTAISDGALARTLVKQNNPNVPPALSCGVAYWRLALDPGYGETLVAAIVSARRVNLSPAAEETIQRLNAADEAQKAIRAYVNPTAPPQPAPDQPQAPKYNRQQLDRLIGNQR